MVYGKLQSICGYYYFPVLIPSNIEILLKKSSYFYSQYNIMQHMTTTDTNILITIISFKKRQTEFMKETMCKRPKFMRVSLKNNCFLILEPNL
jgi:hypothetical protein